MADSTVGMFSAQVFRQSMDGCGLSSRELSDRLGVGVNMISGMRTGKKAPSLESLTRIAALFNRPVADFLDLPAVGERTLRHYRIAAGLNQPAVAKAVQVGPSAVSKWELQRSRPPEDKVVALAALYGTTPEELHHVIDRAHGGPVEQILALTESVRDLARGAVRAVLQEPDQAKQLQTLTDIRGRVLQALSILNAAMPQLDGDQLARAKTTVDQLAHLLSDATES